jgi:hypothetical protein
MAEFIRLVPIDPFTGQRNAGQTRISLLHVNDPVWTDELLARLGGTVGGWFLTKSIEVIYSRQILAVYKAEKRKRNGKTEVLIKDRGTHDIFDCEKYLLALASLTGLGRTDRTTQEIAATGDTEAQPVEGQIQFAA